MKAEIFSHNKLIGSVELVVGDRSMGHIYREFSPAKSYYTDIQQYVWWFNNDCDYEDWFALNLNIQLDNGYFIYAAGGITFDDSRDLSNEPIRVDIAGVDAHIIDDFFLETKPRPFVAKPWETITIEQKLLFEEELKKESGIFNSPTNSTSHPLTGIYFSALCRNGDDVLFVSRRKDDDAQFVVVHLTWKGSLEQANYPKTTFYKDFDEFKYLKTYADKADWKD